MCEAAKRVCTKSSLSVVPLSGHPTSALRCNEEECHQFWSTAISSQERSPLWLLICQLCNSFLFSIPICILQIYHAPVSNSLFNVHRNICLFSVLLVNFMFDWIGFWMLYPEHDHQDVREVQRFHYGEFVMRLVGSSGQMMSLQWTTKFIPLAESALILPFLSSFNCIYRYCCII